MGPKKATTVTVKPDNIITEYMTLTNEYRGKYGDRTIVLLQVGAFYEVYGLKTEQGAIQGSAIEEFSQICQLNISEKKLTYENYQIVMAGFRDYTIDKYLNKITESGFTAVVYVQEKQNSVIKRVFQGVYSIGTYVSYETEASPQMTNNIMCIWLDNYKPISRTLSTQNTKIRDTLVYGVATANIYTGKSSIFEHQTMFYMNPTTFDELERYICMMAPSEILLMSPFDDNTNNSIMQYSGVKNSIIHKFDTKMVDGAENNTVNNCTKQTYVNHILTKFFGEETYSVCTEFAENPIATQAFCFLMNYIQEHNPNLVKNISIPIFSNTTNRMVLANHTLKQLNIIDTDNGKGQYSCVLTFLNKCMTAMGKRKFQWQLLNPTTNIEWLTG
jgi:DNA mismatch repair protein MutS